MHIICAYRLNATIFSFLDLYAHIKTVKNREKRPKILRFSVHNYMRIVISEFCKSLIVRSHFLPLF